MNRIPTGQSGPYCKLIFLMDAPMRVERQKVFGLRGGRGHKTEALTWRFLAVRSSPLHRGGCKKYAAIDEVVGGSIFIRLACGSVVGHGLQHLRSRIDRGRARTLRK